MTRGQGERLADVRPVLQRLHVILGRLAGAEGSRSLIARALNLAHGEAPWLKTAHLTSDGLLTGVEEGIVHGDPEKRQQGEMLLLAHVLELLHTFIGERLTLQLIKEGWPDLILERDDDLKEPHP